MIPSTATSGGAGNALRTRRQSPQGKATLDPSDRKRCEAELSPQHGLVGTGLYVIVQKYACNFFRKVITEPAQA